jgi:hypothetical protein
MIQNGTSIDKKDQHWITRAQSPSKEGIKRTRHMSKMNSNMPRCSNMQQYAAIPAMGLYHLCNLYLFGFLCQTVGYTLLMELQWIRDPQAVCAGYHCVMPIYAIYS